MSLVPSYNAILSESVDSRASGKTLTLNGKYFVSGWTPGVSYSWDPNFWAADIDLTCVSVYYSKHDPDERRLTMVTPRHGIGAAHLSDYIVNETCGFVGSDGSYITRTIQAVEYSTNNTDTVCVLFSSDLPSTVTPCKIVPQSWDSYLDFDRVDDGHVSYPTDTSISTLTLNQFHEGTIQKFRFVSRNTSQNSNWATFEARGLPEYQIVDGDMFRMPGDGDSGNPSFFLYNDEPLFLTHWTSSVYGTTHPDYISNLNAMILAVDATGGVSTGYTVTEGVFEPMAADLDLRDPTNTESAISAGGRAPSNIAVT